jgi:hypothetical protein
MSDRRHQIVQLLCDFAPQEMEDAGFIKRRCILATRVAIETLKHFKIEASAIPVEVRAANKSWLTLAQRNATEAEFLATDAHMIAIRTALTNDEKAYPGHLVARLEDSNYVVDLNTEQFRRPGILMPDAEIFRVPDAFWTDENKEAVFDLKGGGLLGYKRLLTVARTYEDGPDWARKPRWFPIVRNLTLRIEVALRHKT